MNELEKPRDLETPSDALDIDALLIARGIIETEPADEAHPVTRDRAPVGIAPIRIEDPLTNWTVPHGWYLLLIALCTLGVALPAVGRWCQLSPDSVDYFRTARTLYETSAFPRQYMMRPPGFPAFIAPLFAMGDLPLLGIRILLALALVASAMMTYLLYCREIGKLGAMTAALLVSTNSVMLMRTTFALSELVFIPFQLAALYSMDRLRRPGSSLRNLGLLAGLFTTLAIMIRSIGAALIPVGIVALLLRKNDPLARRSIAIGLFALMALSLPTLWHVRQSTFDKGPGYGSMLTHAREAEQTSATGLSLQLQRLIRFGEIRLDGIKSAMTPDHIGWSYLYGSWRKSASLLIGGFFILLCGCRLVRLRSPMDAFALLSLWVLMLWPWNEGVRLIVPLIPIFCGGLAWLVVRLAQHAGPRWGKLPVAAALMLLGVQVADIISTVRTLPNIRDKAVARVEAMQRYGTALERSIPDQAPICSLTRNRSNTKLTIEGGAFLARKEVTSQFDIHEKAVCILGNYEHFYAATENTLVPSLAASCNLSILFRDGDALLLSCNKPSTAISVTSRSQSAELERVDDTSE